MELNVPDDRRLDGRVAVVTGATREHGIGRAIRLRYALEGARIAGLVHYSAAKGGAVGFTRVLGRELEPFGVHVSALASDYTTEALSVRCAVHPAHAEMIGSRRALQRDKLPEDLAGPGPAPGPATLRRRTAARAPRPPPPPPSSLPNRAPPRSPHERHPAAPVKSRTCVPPR
jgi:NAD(P)-dependent dehydrogenase (short-subunit alcohol dehydrogenase family)